MTPNERLTSDFSNGTLAADPARMTPAELVAGLGALPTAPLAMPPQVIEPQSSFRHWIMALVRRPAATEPSINIPT